MPAELPMTKPQFSTIEVGDLVTSEEVLAEAVTRIRNAVAQVE